jgi:glutathione synthase/RimK-type ligase-like ATP-grasp enzyme
VHTVLLGKPHEVRIHINEELAATHKNFWTTPRSKAKAAFFASFLARPPEQFPRYQQHAGMAALCTDIIRNASTKFLGLAPFLRASTDSGDLRHVAEELLKQTGDDPDNAILWMNLSTAFFSVSEHALGLAMQRQGLALRRQFFLPAFRQPARCHVLLVMAPGDLAENMPLDCLLELGEVDLTLYYATVAAPLPHEVPAHDVLVVGLSDTEKNRSMLHALESLLDVWDKPVINRPRHIPNVERNAASVLLQGIPGLSMPLTHQISRTRLQEIVRDPSLEMDAGGEACFPIILRPVGSHAGRNLARINDVKEIADYLTAVPDEEFYLSRFIDYSGADGLFRKYRIALIDGRPFASHMAISSHWMIHYVNAGMYSNGEKRAEEAAFMQNFDRFVGRHRMTLDALAQRIGLDYVCIDCAETREGDLLIFEVDHAMVVHAMDPEDLFPYKQAHVLKARQAFTDLLLQRMSAAASHSHG